MKTKRVKNGTIGLNCTQQLSYTRYIHTGWCRNKIISIHFGISSAVPNQLITLNHHGNGRFCAELILIEAKIHSQFLFSLRRSFVARYEYVFVCMCEWVFFSSFSSFVTRFSVCYSFIPLIYSYNETFIGIHFNIELIQDTNRFHSFIHPFIYSLTSNISESWERERWNKNYSEKLSHPNEKMTVAEEFYEFGESKKMLLTIDVKQMALRSINDAKTTESSGSE